MLTKEGIASLRERLATVRGAANQYFAHADPAKFDGGFGYSSVVTTQETASEGETLRAAIKRLGVDVAGAARGSALISEADLQDLRHNTRQMLANVRFNQYRHWGIHIHHDEDVVLGVDPPSQGEEPVDAPATAVALFSTSAHSVGDLIDLLSPSDGAATIGAGTASYRPNTAFIMMAIDKQQADLEDTKNAIKDVCKEFGIQAITADEIEHDGAITDRILEEIETNEFRVFSRICG